VSDNKISHPIRGTYCEGPELVLIGPSALTLVEMYTKTVSCVQDLTASHTISVLLLVSVSTK